MRGVSALHSIKRKPDEILILYQTIQFIIITFLKF